MNTIMQVLNWCNENYDLITLAAISLTAILRLTKWGKANADALDAVVAVVEKLDAKEVKSDVAALAMALPQNAKDALDDKVALHDDDKPNPNKTAIFARELAKTIGLRLATKR